MEIPKNTLIRNKGFKKIMKKNPDCAIEQIPESSEITYKKRLNQNLRNRLQTLLSYNEIRLDDVADLLSLLETRIELENISLSEAMIRKEKLDEKFGKYTKRYTTSYDIKVDKKCGFIPYEHMHKLTADERKNLGLPLTEQQKEQKWKKKHLSKYTDMGFIE